MILGSSGFQTKYGRLEFETFHQTNWGGAGLQGFARASAMGAQQGKDNRCGSGSSVSSTRGKPAKHYQRSKASSKESRSSLAAGNVFAEHNGQFEGRTRLTQFLCVCSCLPSFVFLCFSLRSVYFFRGLDLN